VKRNSKNNFIKYQYIILKFSSLKHSFQVDNLNYHAFLILMFCLPIGDQLVHLSIIFWILTCFLQKDILNKFRNFKNLHLYYALSAYFIITCIWFAISTDKSSAFSSVESKLSFVLFPPLMMLSGNKLKQNQDKLFMAFIIGNLVASVYCYVHTFATNIIVENGIWHLKLSFLKENEYLSFWQLVNRRTSTFSYEFLSELKQSSYFAMYIIFSLCLAVYLYEKWPDKTKKHKILLASYFIYFSFFIYLLQSRAGIISFGLLLIWMLIRKIHLERKKRYYLITGLIIIFGTFVVISSTKIKYNIEQIEQIAKNPSKNAIEGENDRFQMWYSAIPIIKNSFIFGVGPSNTTDKLVEQYAINKFEIAQKLRLNAHNQYIESLLGLGIIGLGILLYIIIYCLIVGFNQKKHNLIFFILILAFNFIFESMLNRMIGIVFMMSFISLFLFIDFNDLSNTETQNLNKK